MKPLGVLLFLLALAALWAFGRQLAVWYRDHRDRVAARDEERLDARLRYACQRIDQHLDVVTPYVRDLPAIVAVSIDQARRIAQQGLNQPATLPRPIDPLPEDHTA